MEGYPILEQVKHPESRAPQLISRNYHSPLYRYNSSSTLQELLLFQNCFHSCDMSTQLTLAAISSNRIGLPIDRRVVTVTSYLPHFQSSGVHTNDSNKNHLMTMLPTPMWAKIFVFRFDCSSAVTEQNMSYFQIQSGDMPHSDLMGQAIYAWSFCHFCLLG